MQYLIWKVFLMAKIHLVDKSVLAFLYSKIALRILAVLYIKWGVFNWLFCYVKVMPRSCLPDIFFPIMRPLKWGTAWSSISRGIGNTSSQTFDHPSLLNKVGLFWNFWLWPAVILMPFEIEFCAVSHFKGLINCKNISGKQEHSNTFT